MTTTRTQAKASGLLRRYAQHGKDVFDVVIVEDIAVEAAFDQAVVSTPPFDAVCHPTSPFYFDVTGKQAMHRWENGEREREQYGFVRLGILLRSSCQLLKDIQKGSCHDPTPMTGVRASRADRCDRIARSSNHGNHVSTLVQLCKQRQHDDKTTASATC